MRLILIRHGATEWSELGRHTGRTDLQLTALGEAQARALGKSLSIFKMARVFCSPLQRAQRTAELSGLVPFEVTPDLVEVDYGTDEGRTTAQICADFPGWDLFRDGTHGGEPLDDVARRCRRVIAAAATIDGDVALVAHGHLLRILTATYLDEPALWGGHLVLGTASLGLLGQEHGQPAIVRWNDQSHLGTF